MDKEKKQITSLPGFKSNICATSLKNPDYHNIYCQKKKCLGPKQILPDLIQLDLGSKKKFC